MAAPGACALDDPCQHVQVRVADGVLRRPSLQPAVPEHDQRQQQEAEQKEWGGEAQLGPLAQTAWICTSTRTFCGRVIAELHVDDDAPAGAAGRRAHRAEGRERRRAPRVERDGGREGEDALTCETGVGEPLVLPVLQPDVLDAPGRCLHRHGCDGLQLSLRPIARLAPATAAAGGNAAQQRPEAGERTGRLRDEDGGAARCHARTYRAAEAAEEADSERPCTIGVEAADHLAASGAAELVVGRCRGAEDLHPGPGDGDADDQAVALPAGVRALRCHAGDRRAEDEHGKQPLDHGSLPNRNAETAPAASRSRAPPAAKPAVISRSSLTLPIREPSSS